MASPCDVVCNASERSATCGNAIIRPLLETSHLESASVSPHRLTARVSQSPSNVFVVPNPPARIEGAVGRRPYCPSIGPRRVYVREPARRRSFAYSTSVGELVTGNGTPESSSRSAGYVHQHAALR